MNVHEHMVYLFYLFIFILEVMCYTNLSAKNYTPKHVW